MNAKYEDYVPYITQYEREFKSWESRVERIVKRYRDDKRPEQGDDVRFNVLWSNVQTLKAATYARVPMPDVSRRFKDNDPTGRVAALLLERALEFQTKHFRDYGATLGQATYDRFLGGRGTAWVRYDPTFEEAEGEQITEDAKTESQEAQEIAGEDVPVDYVHWRDFGHQVARTWEECTKVWRKVYLSQTEADKRFPGKKLPMDSNPDEDRSLRGTEDADKLTRQALVYEIWDKDTGTAIWLSRSLHEVLDEKEDPLGLEEFFPCPPPLYATLTTDSLIPVPDFSLYQDQANELDTLAQRIDGLIKMLQVRGVYDSSVQELARLFTEGENGTLLPVKNWAAFAEKKGLGGAVDLVDIAPIAAALTDAYGAFEQVKSQIYELTGISDILRGETAPSETATAQQIKNNYASLRLKVYQDEVERFATRLLQIKAEIICNHFDPQSIAKQACWEQMSPADKQLVWLTDPTGQPVIGPSGQPIPGPALQLLKNDAMRSFRVEIETDSMAYQDEQQEKQDRMEFLNACGQFLESTIKISESVPVLAPLAIEMMKYGVTGFRVGKNLEGTIDQAVEQMKQQAQQAASNPKPNPDAIKAQADQASAQIDAQAKTQVAQLAQQAESQRAQMKLQADAQQTAQTQAHEAQMAAIKARNDHAMDQLNLEHQAQLEQLKQQGQQTVAAMQIKSQETQAALDRDTKIVLAQIAAGAQTPEEETAAAEADAQLADSLKEFRSMLKDIQEQANAPVALIRDPTGKAMAVQKGKQTRPIQRDAAGNILGA